MRMRFPAHPIGQARNAALGAPAGPLIAEELRPVTI
jgi:hypothetical protein